MRNNTNTNTNTNIILTLLILKILILVLYYIYRRMDQAKRALTGKIKPNRIFILFSRALLSSRRDAVFYLHAIYLYVDERLN